MLRSYNGIDDGSEVVNVGKSFYIKYNVVESDGIILSCVFRVLDNYREVLV